MRHRTGGRPSTEPNRQDPDAEAPRPPVSSLSAAVLRTLDDLREVLTSRLADGRKVSLDELERLRRKLGEDAARTKWILSERGVGYRMPSPNEA